MISWVQMDCCSFQIPSKLLKLLLSCLFCVAGTSCSHFTGLHSVSCQPYHTVSPAVLRLCSTAFPVHHSCTQRWVAHYQKCKPTCLR